VRQSFTITKESQRDFQDTLKRYLKFSKRTLFEAVNEKAYFVVAGGPDTKGVIRLTHKADFERIKSEMGVFLKPVRSKKGQETKKKRLAVMENYWAQRAVILVIARLRKKKEAIPPASALIKQALAMVRARIRSVGFIRSGWLPALRRLARFSKYGKVKFENGETGKKTGVFKGGVSPATESQGKFAKCIIWNSAAGESKHKGALIRYGQPALEQAMRDETRSMDKYLERKFKEAAHEVGIKTN